MSCRRPRRTQVRGIGTCSTAVRRRRASGRGEVLMRFVREKTVNRLEPAADRRSRPVRQGALR
jgi:hypothetical protein